MKMYQAIHFHNFLIFTDQQTANYLVKREGICNRWKLKIIEEADPDSVLITVNLEKKNGTVMVQVDLRHFEKDFHSVKEIA